MTEWISLSARNSQELQLPSCVNCCNWGQHDATLAEPTVTAISDRSGR